MIIKILKGEEAGDYRFYHKLDDQLKFPKSAAWFDGITKAPKITISNLSSKSNDEWDF